MKKTLREIRERLLMKSIEENLPEFAKACNNTNSNLIIMHQDAFAIDLKTEEYILLGMAIKYAGIKGKEVRIITTNTEVNEIISKYN